MTYTGVMVTVRVLLMGHSLVIHLQTVRMLQVNVHVFTATAITQFYYGFHVICQCFLFGSHLKTIGPNINGTKFSVNYFQYNFVGNMYM